MNNMLLYKNLPGSHDAAIHNGNLNSSNIEFILNTINASLKAVIGRNSLGGRFLFTGFESRRIPSYPKVNMSVYLYLKLCHLPTVDAQSAYC